MKSQSQLINVPAGMTCVPILTADRPWPILIVALPIKEPQWGTMMDMLEHMKAGLMYDSKAQPPEDEK